MDLSQVKVNKVKKSELNDFFNSFFYKNLIEVPFTEPRLKSYLNNPYSEKGDYILYYIEFENQILSYRTLLFDRLYNDYKVCWSSGSWTNPLFRRKGLSKILLNSVEVDYPNQSIIFTRSIESKILYDNYINYQSKIDTNTKELHYDLNILNKRIPNKYVRLMNKFIPKSDKLLELNFSISSYQQSKEINDFLKEKSEGELFPLTQDKINWIFNFPWLLKKANLDSGQTYNFSLQDETFKSDCFSFQSNSDVKLVFARNIRQQAYYLHYAYYKDEKSAQEIAKFIINEMVKYQLSVVVIRDCKILKWVKYYRKPLFVKDYKNFMYYSKELHEVIKDRNYQHGIGELIFT